jgi:hypothetical protein
MSNEMQEFDKLRKLLKLKNYEQPPPGYFNSFSTRVINRVEAESRRRQDKPTDAYWIRRFFSMLESNPVAAGLFGVCTCGLLIAGVAWAEYREPTTYAGGAGTGFQNGSEDNNGTGGSSFSKVLDGTVATHSSTDPMMSMLDTNAQYSSAQFNAESSAMPVLYNPQ